MCIYIHIDILYAYTYFIDRLCIYVFAFVTQFAAWPTFFIETLELGFLFSDSKVRNQSLDAHQLRGPNFLHGTRSP